MRTKEFLITAEPFNTDILTGMLWNLDITGINEEVNCLKVFSNSVTKKEIEYLLNDMIVNKMLISFNIEENYIEEKNWNAEWENSREIIKATDRIKIKPTFKDYTPNENEIVITLDPKMSFGTGDHQTTKLILNLLEKYVLKDMKVLDVGTGTGILAIASVKLGAKKVIAHDIDNWCYENGIENSELNSTIDSIDFRICKINEIKE
jgi:ribosomal protein L11 methyltransferase